jgi:hypothetical protein
MFLILYPRTELQPAVSEFLYPAGDQHDPPGNDQTDGNRPTQSFSGCVGQILDTTPGLQHTVPVFDTPPQNVPAQALFGLRSRGDLSVLPRKDITEDEVLRQLEVRHRKRQASIDAAYRKQQKDGLLPLAACSPK